MPDINQLQTGYATNFGAGHGSNTNRVIENFIVASTFRVLVTRFALMHKELKMLDNSVSTYYAFCYFVLGLYTMSLFYSLYGARPKCGLIFRSSNMGGGLSLRKRCNNTK